MLQYLLISLAGLAGSAHCLGMCGGFVCVMGKDRRGAAATLRRHLLYNLGRVTTYCFLGAAVGYLAMLLAGNHAHLTAAGPAQRALAVVSGALMFYIGLQFFGLFHGRRWHPLGAGADFLASSLRQLLKAPGPGAPLALGALNGFLPCPLVYAFVLQAATCGSPLPGLLTMAAFGLGTFPAMLAMGAIGVWLRPAAARPGAISSVGASLARSDWRRHSLRVAGGFIVVLGIITFARGVLPMGAHLH
jgi:sulfite exporter TauE/SafE